MIFIENEVKDGVLFLLQQETKDLIKELQRAADESEDHGMPFVVTLISRDTVGNKFEIMVNSK